MLDESDQSATAVSVCAEYGNDPAALIEILHVLQDREGMIADAALPAIAKALNLSRAEVHGVVSFYHDFRHEPAGRVVLKICRAEACQSMGALELIDRVCARHNVALGETSPSGLTVEPVYCLGNCALSPAAMVNGRLHGRLNAQKLDAILSEGLA